MRIEEEIKRSGYFWLPNNPDKKVPGTLSIVDGGKIELELIGLFNEKIQEFSISDDLNRINGSVEKDGYVTLEDCFYIRKTLSFGSISTSRIFVHKMFSGVAYDKDELISFNSLSFSIEGLDVWLNISGIRAETSYDNGVLNLTYIPPTNLSYKLSNGMRLDICFAHTFPLVPSINEAKVTQRAYIKLTSEKAKCLNDFTEIALKLNHFISYAVDETVTIKDLIAKSSDIKIPYSKDKIESKPIKVYFQSRFFSSKNPDVKHHKMVISYNDIQNIAEKVFNNWINAYDTLSSSFELYFLTKINAYKYIDGQFLALAHGLEALHRNICKDTIMSDEEFKSLISKLLENCPNNWEKLINNKLQFANELTLKNRLDRIIKPMKKYFGNDKDVKKFIRKIVDTRNYYTHYTEGLKSRAAKGKEIYYLIVKIEFIFLLKFLSIIGLSNTEIDDLVKKRSLRRKLLT